MVFPILSKNVLLLVLLFTPIFIGAAALVFKHYQNSKELIGGIISTPKSLWLSYTVTTWFFLPIIFLFLELHPLSQKILFIHLISFWLRGLIELVMIYRLFNWSPLYGITHSSLHGLGLLWAAFLLLNEAHLELNDRVILCFCIFQFICVSFEVIFATLFFKIRGQGNYHEKHTIYFASDEPQWRRVNNLTILALCFGIGGYIVSAGLLIF